MRRDGVGTILLQPSLGGLGIETDLLAHIESLQGFVAGEEVPIEIGDFSDMGVLL